MEDMWRRGKYGERADRVGRGSHGGGSARAVSQTIAQPFDPRCRYASMTTVWSWRITLFHANRKKDPTGMLVNRSVLTKDAEMVAR
jgi:hypothetical protein